MIKVVTDAGAVALTENEADVLRWHQLAPIAGPDFVVLDLHRKDLIDEDGWLTELGTHVQAHLAGGR